MSLVRFFAFVCRVLCFFRRLMPGMRHAVLVAFMRGLLFLNMHLMPGVCHAMLVVLVRSRLLFFVGCMPGVRHAVLMALVVLAMIAGKDDQPSAFARCPQQCRKLADRLGPPRHIELVGA